jgi:LCP family protein required for cell wall assembly
MSDKYISITRLFFSYVFTSHNFSDTIIALVGWIYSSQGKRIQPIEGVIMSNKHKNENDTPRIEIPKFMDRRTPDNSDTFIKDINTSLSQQVNSYYDDDIPVRRRRRRKRKKFSKILRVLLCFFICIIALSGLMLFTSGGRRMIINIAGKYIYSNLEYHPADDTQVTNSSGVDSLGSDDIAVGPVINILLIGVEEFEGAQNTDTIMIATMNTKDHTLKLTSLMRDLYVEIPGHDNNKLNAAYPIGEINLLYETIKVNFGITVDGYCKVNFDAFQKIVDLVGGVEISLTGEEAHYLQTTNYISIKANRNVVEGPQIMNGNQALGYCRIRKVSTGSENNDFGRTQRHRIVLEAIYDKVRTKNIVDLVLLMNNILTQVKIKTDIKQKAFNKYLEEAVSLKVKEIETLRIPTDGSFDNASVPIGSRNVSVLEVKDWGATREELYNFIYGVALDEDTEPTE